MTSSSVPADGSVPGAGSRADSVSAAIRREILSGQLEPGHRLTFPDFCRRYEVSAGVLREALMTLVDRGLVRSENNRGFRVIELSAVDHAELGQVRAAIEPVFIREAVQSGTPEWEAAVLAAHHLMVRQPLFIDGVVNQELILRHADFHNTLVSGCGNHRMIALVTTLRDQADLYLRWSLDVQDLEPEGRLRQEDTQLLAAALDRDPDRAETLARLHITGSADSGQVPRRLHH
jgi:DNA-binding GntR family transcriptional regulator